MPELPEVETVCRGLEPFLVGETIGAVTLNRSGLRKAFGDHFPSMLQGRQIVSIERRAKYILIRLDNGLIWMTHLGMTGSFHIEAGAAAASHNAHYYHHKRALKTHDHVVIFLNNGTQIIYNDPRRFGWMEMISGNALAEHPSFADLGPEPLSEEWGASALLERARGRSAPLKTFLLDQKNVAGLGNIYVCEALFRTQLNPQLPASALLELPIARTGALVAHIKQVLHEAIAAGGSSLRDFKDVGGDLGTFQHRFAVYDREGEPCLAPDCGGVIHRLVQGGRSTFFCPSCQPQYGLKKAPQKNQRG